MSAPLAAVSTPTGLKQIFHAAVVQGATPHELEGHADNSINAGSQSQNNIDFVPINPERLQYMANDTAL